MVHTHRHRAGRYAKIFSLKRILSRQQNDVQSYVQIDTRNSVHEPVVRIGLIPELDSQVKNDTSGIRSKIRVEVSVLLPCRNRMLQWATPSIVTESTGSNHQNPEKADSAGWCGTKAS
jgi:hypothetical protein